MSNIVSRQEFWRATLIQRTRDLDLIVARALFVADFIDSICHKPTFLEAIELTSNGSKKEEAPTGGRGLFGFLWGNHDGGGKTPSDSSV